MRNARRVLLALGLAACALPARAGGPAAQGATPRGVKGEPYGRLVSGIAESNARFSGLGFTLLPRPQAAPPAPASPIIDDIHTVWDQSKFAVAREPIVVGKIEDTERFSNEPAPLIADMPIKFPGTEYRVPIEASAMKEVIQKIIDFEHAVNPHADDYYSYLTLDPRSVEAGKSQRGIGLHSDSIQGPRIQPKTPIEHGYIGADHTPTLIQKQAFDVRHLDPAKHLFNTEFERQADPAKAVFTEPYTIYMIDAYTVHSAVPARVSGPRRFFRVIHSLRQFDRVGNSHNPLFDYRWEMVPRPLPSGLIR